MFQLSSALLDACVLSILNQADTYGYVLTQKMKEVFDVSESTLYPVLRRLQKDLSLIAYDEPVNGRNRRYYQITQSGKQKLDEYVDEWQSFKVKLDTILLGGTIDE